MVLMRRRKHKSFFKKKLKSCISDKGTYGFNTIVFLAWKKNCLCLCSSNLFLSVLLLSPRSFIYLKCVFFMPIITHRRSFKWGCGEREAGNLTSFGFQLYSKSCFISNLINQIGYMMTSVVWNWEKSGKMPNPLDFSQSVLPFHSY